jgi:hypothetical protein
MKGSIWNKWDLHIHSPMTHLANCYPNIELSTFVKKIQEAELSQIAITNYFYFQDNELEAIREAVLSIDAQINVLGNLEFRISQPNKDGDFVNIHCLFHQSLSTQEINERMRYLELFNRDRSGGPIQCAKESILASHIGVDSIVVDYSKLIEHLQRRFKIGKEVLVAICPRGHGGFRPPRKNAGSAVGWVAKPSIWSRPSWVSAELQPSLHDAYSHE